MSSTSLLKYQKNPVQRWRLPLTSLSLPLNRIQKRESFDFTRERQLQSSYCSFFGCIICLWLCTFMFQAKSVSLIQPGFCLYQWNIANVNVIHMPSLLMSIYAMKNLSMCYISFISCFDHFVFS